MSESFSTRLLRMISRSPDADDNPNDPWDPTDPLQLVKDEVPGFLAEYVRGKRVVDFGCNTGDQSLTLLNEGATEVVGIDINEAALSDARALIEREGVADKIQFVTHPDQIEGEPFDLVLSQNAFEHFDDAKAVLQQMRDMIKPGGHVVLSFGPPWRAPYGSHMYFFCRLPYSHLLFPEKAVMTVRQSYRNDGYRTYAEAGLNKMLVKQFESLVRECGLELQHRKYTSVLNLPLIGSIPGVREFFVNHISAVLRRPEA
tara:strand:+ start:4622 stop:5395 length:774 start_codon:yes stop_codon:yes gene_type:complete